MRPQLPDSAAAGDMLHFRFTVFDDNRETSDVTSTIDLVIESSKEQRALHLVELDADTRVRRAHRLVRSLLHAVAELARSCLDR